MEKFIRELRRLANYVNTHGEVMEVADWACDQNIEMDNDNKYIIFKPVKRRDIDSSSDQSYYAVAHPFISQQSFALRHDILENCPVSIQLFSNVRSTNMAAAANI